MPHADVDSAGPRLPRPALAWAAAWAFAGAAAAGEGIRWRTDFNQAAIEAQQQGKLLVVSVHTKWCGPCRQMERTTFADPGLAALLNGECIAVKVDGDEHPELVRSWGVANYPTELCVGTVGADRGKILARMVGAKSARDYIAEVRGALAQSPRPAPQGLPGDGAVVAAAGSAAAAGARGEAIRAVAHRSAEDLPLAVEGRCPVTMVERHTMIVGQAAESLVHHDQVWRFASREAKLKFQANPEKYLPGENGRCPVTFVETGRWQPGALRFPALHLDRVYFLADEAARKKFLDDPEKYLDAEGRARRAP